MGFGINSFVKLFILLLNSKEAQKCYCGTEICRGFLGGTKRIQLQSNKKSATELEEEESERKKKELFEDRDTVSVFYLFFCRSICYCSQLLISPNLVAQSILIIQTYFLLSCTFHFG